MIMKYVQVDYGAGGAAHVINDMLVQVVQKCD